MAHRGSCLCGSGRYEIGVLPEDSYNCHCSACRKAHGAAFATFGFVPNDQFRWLSGEELLRTYAPSHHIFVGSKAPWHEVSDSLSQFDEWAS